MGLIGSGLLVLLTVQFGVPYWIALAIALVAGVVYGAIIELAVVRRLFTAPRVILLVATIGVSQLSAAILLAFPDIDNARAGYPLPFDTRVLHRRSPDQAGARRRDRRRTARRARARLVPQPHAARPHRAGGGGEP